MNRTDPYNVNLKNLRILEKVLYKDRKIIIELGTRCERAVITKNGTLQTRTHNVDIVDNQIMYESSNSKWYTCTFEHSSDARRWWYTFIVPKIIQIK